MLGEAYLSVAEAAEYTVRIADIAAWSDAAPQAQAAALAQASDEIDTLQFAGVPFGDWLAGQRGVQARAFPRAVLDEYSTADARYVPGTGFCGAAVYDIDPDDSTAAVVPQQVKLATLHQAMTILRDPNRVNRLRDQADGVLVQTAGTVTEQYELGRAKLVCLEAMALLRPYLLSGGRIRA